MPVSGLESVVRGAGTSGAALMCRMATGTQGVVGAGGAREYLDEGPAGSSEGLAGGAEPLRSTASRTEVPVSGAGQSPVQSSVPAAGAHGTEDGLGGLDAFLQSVLAASVEDKRRTVVFSAPEELLGSDESSLMLQERSQFVRRVLQHEALGSVGRECVIKAEYVIAVPGWRTGRGGIGPERVTVNFLHVEFAEAEQAEALEALFSARCGSAGWLELLWGGEVHRLRIAKEGNAARVLGQSTGAEGRVELTTHPVWWAAVSNLGFSLSRSDLAQRFGEFAVVRIMQKYKSWGVDALLRFVAVRPVLQHGSEVVQGLMLVVEVERAPWVLPMGVALADGHQEAQLRWNVRGPRRHPWDSKEPPVAWGGQGGAGRGGAFGPGPVGPGGKGGKGPGLGGWAPWGKGKGESAGVMPGGKGGPGPPWAAGKGGPGVGGGPGSWGQVGGGGKGVGGGVPTPALVQEHLAWVAYVRGLRGEAAVRRDALMDCWGPTACPRAVYFALYRDAIVPCRGRCKTAQVTGVRALPCSEAGGDLPGLVPPHLRREAGGPAQGAGPPLFGGVCRGMPPPPCVKGGRRGGAGQAAQARREVGRWETGRAPPPSSAGGRVAGGEDGAGGRTAGARLGGGPAPREAGAEAGDGGEVDGEGDMVEEPYVGGALGVLLEEDDGTGGARQRGLTRALDSGDAAEAGPPAKVPRSPTRGGDSDGLSQD